MADVRLGDAIGSYQNPGPQGKVIGIFADGLAWNESGRLIELRFADMLEVVLPNEKESEALLIRMHDGAQFSLPVAGRQGRFFESLEVLRFLDRVMADARRKAVETG